MVVLGLDTATKTGWAFYDSKSGKVIESGVQDFSKKRGESNGLLFMRFRKWLQDLVKLAPVRVGLVAYERAHHRGGAATELCVNLTGRVQEICAGLEIECAAVPTMTLKKWATGKGNAGKSEMIEAALKVRHSSKVAGYLTDDEADAIHVARWAAEEYA